MGAAVFVSPDDQVDVSGEETVREPLPDTGLLAASVISSGGAGPLRQWPTFAGDGTPTGLQSWRTYTVGGNCCEHYLATSPDGWIVNLGGGTPAFSTDGGTSWKRAVPNTPLIGAEGAVVSAPGGDIVGMTWDPYTGDQIYAYRYDAEGDVWNWNLVNLNTPFYDRPWLSVAPGPFLIGDVEVPYVTFMRGGLVKFPQFMSLDGLHYEAVEHTYVATLANAVDIPGVTTLDALPDFGVTHEVDFYNPHPSALGTPLLRGGYLAPIPHVGESMYRYAVLDQDLTWKALKLDLPRGELFFDSAGGIHNIVVYGNAWIIHRYSTDGGATWSEYTHKFEQAFVHWSFAVSTAADVAAFLLHHDGQAGDQAVLVKTRGFADSLEPDEVLFVGAGDLNTGVGLGSSAPRFDFTTLGLLPDGRAVAAFIDSQYRPGFAIEQSSATATGLPLLG